MLVWRPVRPAKPRHPHQRRATVPTTATRRPRGPKQRGEHQPSKPLAWREELSRPRSPASTPRFDVPPEQRSGALACPGRNWMQAQLYPRSMPLAAIQCRTVQQARHQLGSTWLLRWDMFTQWKNEIPHSNSNSCLLPRDTHDRRSLPHFRRCVKQWGCPAVDRCVSGSSVCSTFLYIR